MAVIWCWFVYLTLILHGLVCLFLLQPCVNAATPAPEAFSIRLTGGDYESSGRVEIFDGDSWGVICIDDNQHQWNLNAALVACRQLGYPSALAATGIHGDASRSFVISRDVSCVGTESKLTDCEFVLSRTHGCAAGRFEAAVICKPRLGDSQPSYSLSLVGGSNSSEGNIQIQPFGEKWSICNDETWDLKAATVVCRELGYEYAMEITGNNTFRTESTWIVVRSIRCSGAEKYILECSHSIKDQSFCHDPVAGVRCSTEPSPPPGKVIRLVGSPVPYEGQVQTYYNSLWWNICTDAETRYKGLADTVCESLGYGPGAPLPTLRYSENYTRTSTDNSLISQSMCHGSNRDLSTCKMTVSYHTKCGYYDKAAIHCDPKGEPRGNPFGGVPLRLNDGDNIASGRVVYYWIGRWYTLCSWSDWDINAATVVCHQLGFAGAKSTGILPLRGEATRDIGFHYLVYKCSGKERFLDNCHAYEPPSDCHDHEKDVSVSCVFLPYNDTDDPGDGDDDEIDSDFSTFAVIIAAAVVVSCICTCLLCGTLLFRSFKQNQGTGNNSADTDRRGDYGRVSDGTEMTQASSAATAPSTEHKEDMEPQPDSPPLPYTTA